MCWGEGRVEEEWTTEKAEYQKAQEKQIKYAKEGVNFQAVNLQNYLKLNKHNNEKIIQPLE